MATMPKTSILTTKNLGVTCPACGQPLMIDIQLDLEPITDAIEYDSPSPEGFQGDRKATVQLIGAVKGSRISHDCIPQPKRDPGRPRKVAVVAPDEPVDATPSKTNAEAHRDRLREHEVVQGRSTA